MSDVVVRISTKFPGDAETADLRITLYEVLGVGQFLWSDSKYLLLWQIMCLAICFFLMCALFIFILFVSQGEKNRDPVYYFTPQCAQLSWLS